MRLSAWLVTDELPKAVETLRGGRVATYNAAAVVV